MNESGEKLPELESSFSVPEAIMRKWEEGAPNFEIVTDALKEKGYEVTGGRRFLSSGFNGPLYVIPTVQGRLVEKAFIYGGEDELNQSDLGHRMRRMNLDSLSQTPVRPHHSIIDGTGKPGDVVVDWVANEEHALEKLHDIPGIPKFISTVLDGKKGSVIEEFIDGYELTDLPKHTDSADEIHQVIDRIMHTYDEAAKRNYIYNNIEGSTILVDRATRQPYLVDWYNHTPTEITADKEESIAAGRADLRNLENRLVTEIHSHPGTPLQS